MKDTPRTDAKMFPAWRWDTHTMEYVPHGIGFPAEDARKLERELTAVTEQRDEARRLAERYRDLSCDTLEKADETLLPWEITSQNEP
jgi:hypothetical protein